MSTIPPTNSNPEDERRCPICGYRLAGMGDTGACPECGSHFAPDLLLKPWPSAGTICWQLGWPLFGVLFGAVLVMAESPLMIPALFMLWGMLVAIPINSYLRVRKLLRDCVPDQVRTRGPIGVFRTVGTTVCVILFLAFFVGPMACVVVALSSF